MIYRYCNNPASQNYRRTIGPGACRRCKGPPMRKPGRNKSPGLLRRAVSYTEAVIEWTAAGRPEQSDKDVRRIFEEHCKPCKRFDSDRQRCLDCGCRVAEDGHVLFNKIKMGTQHCPRGKW